MEENARDMIDELLDSGNLSKWEMGFIEWLSEKMDNGKDLSDNELEKLKEIHGQM